MQHSIATYLTYVMSAITIYTMFLAGQKTAKAWLLGFREVEILPRMPPDEIISIAAKFTKCAYLA